MGKKRNRTRSKKYEFNDIICCVFCRSDLLCQNCIAGKITEEMYRNYRLADFLKSPKRVKL